MIHDNRRVLLVGLLALFLAPACHRNQPPNQPPPPNGPAQSRVGTVCRFTASAVDPENQLVQVRLDWDVGDTTEWSTQVGSGDTVPFDYAWPVPGAYRVSAQARDASATVSLWSEWHEIVIADTVNIRPDAPSIAGRDTGVVGTEYDFVVAGRDSNNDRIAYQFDWGNGDTSAWGALVGSGTKVTMTNSWPDTGAFMLQARSRDEKGALSNWSPGHWLVILLSGKQRR